MRKGEHWCLGYTAVMRTRISGSWSKFTVSSAPKHKPEAGMRAGELLNCSCLLLASVLLPLASRRAAAGDFPVVAFIARAGETTRHCRGRRLA